MFTFLSVQLCLTKEQKNESKNRKKRVDNPQSGSVTPDIMAMWQVHGQDGTMGKLISYLPQNAKMTGLVGICFSDTLEGKDFPYEIGVEYDGRSID